MAYCNRGEAYYKLGKDEETKKYLGRAKRDIEEVIKLNSEFSETHNLLGVIFADKNEFQEAGKRFEKAIKF
ncbi:MAG: hypothetical protein DRP06_02300, partial [Candidatus Aenigmatarchaeota archaeon]